MEPVTPIRLSQIDFRPDPTRPNENVVPLGRVVIFHVNGSEVVEFRSRTNFSTDEVAKMDDLYVRMLVENPGETLRKRVEQVMSASSGPADAFANLATTFRGSIVASAPIDVTNLEGSSEAVSVRWLVDRSRGVIRLAKQG